MRSRRAGRGKLRNAKDRTVEMEKALVDATLDLRLERSYLETACEPGWQGSVDDLRKVTPKVEHWCRNRPDPMDA